jgi:hypothetical protein
MAKRSKLLSKEELDLVDFLVAHVTSLSSSLACEAFIAKLSVPPPVTCEVVYLQSNLIVDARVGIIRSSTLLVVALEHQGTGVGESFKVKPPDLSALEVCLKGNAFVCSRRSARLAAKHRRGTFELPGPCHRLPSKVVSKRRLPCPRSCSLRFMRCGASSDLRYVAPPPPGRLDVSGVSLRSAWRKDVEAPPGRFGCCE